jgi:NAD(P)-dependent dehydrogenase (short-subunit alcohol dehydrogenase family)
MSIAPMAALLEPLAKARGRLVLISSSAVDAPPPDWPHYVAAKCALEGVVRSVAVAHPRIAATIARPPRMHSDMMNTLRAQEGTMFVEHVATALATHIVERVPGREPSGGVVLLDDFAPRAARGRVDPQVFQ